jgi:hypothetical protein
MKKFVPKLKDEELLNYPIADLVDGWFFQIEEISMGHFKVEGIDRWRRVVSREGTELEIEEMVKACANDARSIEREIKETNTGS